MAVDKNKLLETTGIGFDDASPTPDSYIGKDGTDMMFEDQEVGPVSLTELMNGRFSANGIHIGFHDSSGPSVGFANKDNYQVVSSFPFPGSSNFNPECFNAVMSRLGTNGTAWVRLYDYTNGLEIAEFSLTASGKAIYEDTSLNNLPTGEAIFEIQVKIVGTPSSTSYIHSATLGF